MDTMTGAVRKFLGDAGPPRYTLKVPRRRPVLDPFRTVIDQWLKDGQDQPPKQRHTANRIYDRLVSEFAFQGGESTVRVYVRQVRPRRQVMIPLDHDPGEAQVDWGEAQVYLDFRRTKVNLFCLGLCYSQRFFVTAFPRQSQKAFFAGHVAAFHEFVGVPKVIVYDNLSTAVKRVLTGSRREEQREFTGFRSHHLFGSRFCRPGEAHEKGMVENLVGYVRRNFLVPLPSVASFEELNVILKERCQRGLDRQLRGRGQFVAQAWEEEKDQLLPLPPREWPCVWSPSITTATRCPQPLPAATSWYEAMWIGWRSNVPTRSSPPTSVPTTEAGT
jgi:transposase